MEALSQPISVLPVATTTPSFGKGAVSRTALERTAKDFESVFMAQMLKPMWDGLDADGMFGGGRGEEVMRDMLIQEYGKAVAQGDKSGLTSAIMNEMIRMQNTADRVSAQGGNA